MADQNVDPDTPEFVATSTSAKQLFLLLRCISFGDKVQMQISDEGVRFSVEDSAVMEGMGSRKYPPFYMLRLSQAWHSCEKAYSPVIY
jgi:Repair protein Rad1/Rec1/Rad17